jgi:glycyl-tRNA synthetase beta subunit
MCEDVRLRNNRLALLAAVRDLFLRVADISRLAID